LKTLVVAGARPNFMKVAPVLAALRAAGHQGLLVHTGQHSDPAMSDSFFRDLQLPEPDYSLGVGAGSHARQTAQVMERFEPVLVGARPDWVVVVGDVNSTLACALVTAKLKNELGCGLAHVEAGLRSHDWRMPEEVNRVLTDRLSDLLLMPSTDALENLTAEGLDAERAVMVGNVMIDTLVAMLPRARAIDVARRWSVEDDGYAVVTLHRPSNVDEREPLGEIFDALEMAAGAMPVVFPIHPRTRQKAEEFGLLGKLERLTVVEPLGYLEMLSLLDRAAVVISDSGGVQEETTALGVPCLTLREQTERPVTVTEGTNRLVPWPLTKEGVFNAFREARAEGRALPRSKCPAGWDGHAAERIVQALEAHASSTRRQTLDGTM
jgi:UDP-N-acetylglucosamine 2-epimerase (non-hydrolysing)